MPDIKTRKRKEFAARLQRAADYRGLPEHGKATIIAKAFHDRGIEMKSMSVGRWFKAITMPSSANLQILAEILNVRMDWLATGNGAMVSTRAQTSTGEEVRVVVTELPLLTLDQLDDWLGGLIAPPKDILVSGAVSAKAFVFRMPDNSLMPSIMKGALLVVDPARTPSDTLPVMAVHSGSALFGALVTHPGACLIEPYNTAYPAARIDRSTVIGAVIGLAQQFF